MSSIFIELFMITHSQVSKGGEPYVKKHCQDERQDEEARCTFKYIVWVPGILHLTLNDLMTRHTNIWENNSITLRLNDGATVFALGNVYLHKVPPPFDTCECET